MYIISIQCTYYPLRSITLRRHRCFAHSDRRFTLNGGIRSAFLTTNALSFRPDIKAVIANSLIINILHNTGSQKERPAFCNWLIVNWCHTTIDKELHPFPWHRLTPRTSFAWQTTVCHSGCEYFNAPGRPPPCYSAFCGHRPLSSVKNAAHLE